MVYCRFLVVVRLFRLRGIMQTNRPTWLHFAPSRNERAEYGSNLLDRLVKDLKERMASGRDQYIEKCRREGIKMGRPSTYRKSINEYKKQYQREFSLIRKGLSLANISAITGTSINTIRINFYYIFFFCKRQRQNICSVVCFCVIALREQAFEDLPPKNYAR